jgi:hypothetical protein
MNVSLAARRTLLLVSLLVAAAARADVVHLVGGGKLEGEIAEETDKFVVVKAGGGKVSIARSQIESIERTPAPPPLPKNASTKTGPHFRVTCHFADDAFAAEALAWAEDAWPATIEAIGAAPAKLDHPLDVHIYRDPDEFAAVEKKFFGGSAPKDRGGFADRGTQTAYVTVQDSYDGAVWKRFGAPTWKLDTVAHEAAHLTALVGAANGRFHPSWFAEGLAEHVEKFVHRARTDAGGPTSDLYMSMQMAACRLLRRQGLLPEPRAIVQERIGHLDEFNRYAVNWAFFELLLRPEQRARTEKLLAEMRAMEAGDSYGRRLAGAFDTIWGDAGLDDLNDAFRRLVDSFEPKWEAWGAADVRVDQWITWSADGKSGAEIWRPPGVAAKAFRISGAFEILKGDGQANVLFGRNDDGFIAAALSGKTGATVYEYRASDKSWRTVAHGVDALPVGEGPTAFDVQVDGEAVRVSVGGKPVVETTLPGRNLSGPWGVGVGAGTTAVWTGVTVK